MDLNTILDSVQGLSIGTVISGGCILSAIAGGISTATIKLYKIFSKYRELQEENETLHNHVDQHGESLIHLSQKIDNLCDSINARFDDMDASIDLRFANLDKKFAEQQEVNLHQTRGAIIDICETAINNKQITANKNRLLGELMCDYDDIFHADGYIHDLFKRVKGVPIIGTTME